MASVATGGRTVAIFPWGEVIEEFLEPIGLEIADFVGRMTGGWLFGHVQAFQSQGWRPVIICASEVVRKPTRLMHAATGAPVWAVPGRRSGSGHPARMPSLRYVEQRLRSPSRAFAAVLAEEGCDIILVQEYEYFRCDLLGRVAHRTNRPIFATFQGGSVTLSALEWLVRPRALRRCGGLIVASAQERRRLGETYPGLRVPIASIPNPIDTGEWRPQDRVDARRALGLPASAFIVLNHGRTDIERKGLDVLVRAWTRFAHRHPDAQAFIIGSGQDQASFDRLLAREKPERLTWMASYVTDREQMRRWLSAADAYLITSRTEGMPVAPLEAMACGLPVISSDAHGLPDIFAAGEQDGGILTARGDIDGVVAALERLAADANLRKNLGVAARERVEQHFSISAVGAALVGFFGDR
ncbi:MAG: glycosyltransferase family 4 protein [Dongiaceae bacterium]